MKRTKLKYLIGVIVFILLFLVVFLNLIFRFTSHFVEIYFIFSLPSMYGLVMILKADKKN